MPDRTIHESICASETLNKLSDFGERFWHRLTVCVDDYGRLDARPAVLKGRLFPLRPETTAEEITEALQQLLSVDLILLYQVEGKPFLQIATWTKYQRIRSKKSKYPAPEEGEPLPLVDIQPTVDSSPLLVVDPNEHGSPALEPKPKRKRNPSVGAAKPSPAWSISFPPGTDTRFSLPLLSAITDWLTYKHERREDYKETGLKALLSGIEKKTQDFGEEAVIGVIQLSMANGWKGIVWDKLTAFAIPASSSTRNSGNPSSKARKNFWELAEQLGEDML